MHFPVFLNQKTKNLSVERVSKADVEIVPVRGDGSAGRWRWGKDRVKASVEILEARQTERSGRWGIEYRVYLNPGKSPIQADEGPDDDDDDGEDSAERTAKPKSVWLGPEFSTDVARRTYKALAVNANYDYPKATDFIKRCVYLGMNKNQLMMDFFAGSCTTAQAVLELNQEDGGNRKFIMVQLPEPTGNKDYPTIAEIGKERIRRVLAKLKKAAAESLKDDSAQAPDLGFKVFKLAAPHIQPWSAGDADREPDKYAAKLALYNDPLVPGWIAENVLWEIALREGFGLNTRFESKKLKTGNTIWLATDPEKDPPQTLIVCLDEKIVIGFSKSIDLTPEQIVVARDLALDDTAAANLALQSRLKTI